MSTIYECRLCRRPTTFVVAVVLILWAPSLVEAQEPTYEPGPVVPLHEWLGDQCSFVPDLDVGDCCMVHDIAYQVGGDRSDRLVADQEFRECILDHNRPIVAHIYYTGVRLFGWLFFNWGG